jgi:hypothetical protein
MAALEVMRAATATARSTHWRDFVVFMMTVLSKCQKNHGIGGGVTVRRRLLVTGALYEGKPGFLLIPVNLIADINRLRLCTF